MGITLPVVTEHDQQLAGQLVTDSRQGSKDRGIGMLVEIVLSSAGLYTLAASYGGDDFFSPSSDIEDHVVIPGLHVPYIVK